MVASPEIKTNTDFDTGYLTEYVGLRNSTIIKLVDWVDEDYKESQMCGLPVSDIDRIPSIEFDYIFIAAIDPVVAQAAFEKLTSLGVPKEKITHIQAELGDILFVLVNIAKFKKIDAEEALRMTNNKFIKRFQYIEQEVAKKGKILKETSLAEMERYWQEAKNIF